MIVKIGRFLIKVRQYNDFQDSDRSIPHRKFPICVFRQFFGENLPRYRQTPDGRNTVA